MAYDGPETRDVLLGLKTLSHILTVFQKLKTTLSESTRNRLAWTVCALHDLDPPPEYAQVEGAAKYLSYSLEHEKEPNTLHYLLKTVALILQTLRKEAIAKLKEEGVLSQIQNNFLALKDGNHAQVDEYLHCFSYFISDQLRVQELVDILSEDNTFKALAKLLDSQNPAVGILSHVVEEKDEGTEDLLKYNSETLNLLSKIVTGESGGHSHYQDAIRLIGNLLYFGNKETRRAVLTKIAEKSIISRIMKSMLNLKDPVIQSLLRGIAEAAKALKSEKSVSQQLLVIKEAFLDSDALAWKYLVLKKDPKFNQLLDVLKTELDIKDDQISKGSKKPAHKRMGTMAQVVQEGKKFLEGAEFDPNAKKTRGRKGKAEVEEKKTAGSASKKKGSKKGGKGKPEEEKKAETPKGKAASKSKGKKGAKAIEEETAEPKFRKKIIPTTRAIKRTKTMIETLKQSEQILAGFEEGPRSGRKASATKQQNQAKQPQEEEKQQPAGRGKRGQKAKETVEEPKEVPESSGRGKRKGKEEKKEEPLKEEPKTTKRTKKK